MRIAVLVYGRLNRCVEHYDNILSSIGSTNHIDFFLSSDNQDDALLNDFIRLYKPIAYNNESTQYDYDLEKYRSEYHSYVKIHNLNCHFINKNRVFLLLEEYINKEDVKYDCVISLRIDCAFQNSFAFDNLEENTIYIPSGNDYAEEGLNDQIAYGKVDVMKKYHSINHVDILEKKLSVLHPESINYANIIHIHKLQVERVSLEYYLDK
jgi:hypothetical protein